MTLPLTITPSALKRLKALHAEKADNAFFRIRVDTGGCFGFQYQFLLTPEQAPDDLLLQQDGAKILVDPLSQSFLERATLDYTEEMIGSRFVITNPQADSSCGCKNSFTLKQPT